MIRSQPESAPEDIVAMVRDFAATLGVRPPDRVESLRDGKSYGRNAEVFKRRGEIVLALSRDVSTAPEPVREWILAHELGHATLHPGRSLAQIAIGCGMTALVASVVLFATAAGLQWWMFPVFGAIWWAQMALFGLESRRLERMADGFAVARGYPMPHAYLRWSGVEVKAQPWWHRIIATHPPWEERLSHAPPAGFPSGP